MNPGPAAMFFNATSYPPAFTACARGAWRTFNGPMARSGIAAAIERLHLVTIVFVN